MATFKTRSIPTFHAPRPGVAKAAKMPALKLPTMRSGAGLKPPSVSLSKAAAGGRAPAIRATAPTTRIAYAASSSSPGALGVPPAGYKKQRDQAL